ncbi:MAG: T9SS type A sorting domain-containing protein [Bacteroidia bacterium]|nr:T9SS type A sorting domain-containing protein [Bacteroidia bacterium]
MRYLHITLAAATLLGAAWAQAARQSRVFQRKSEIEAAFKSAKWTRFEEGINPRMSSYHRTTVLPPLTWLKPSQDADTVPNTPPTQPSFGGDTLLANNAGQDIDPLISSDCHHSFFDSLYATGAWLIYSSQNAGATFFGNFLFPPSNTTPDTVFYIGGGVAERYDIDPCALNGTGSSIYVKGIAAHVLNNFNISSNAAAVCNPNTIAPSNDDGDGAYTIYYQLLDTIQIPYAIDVNDTRVGSYPFDTIASASKPLSAVRIGYNTTNGQCVGQVINRLERLDYAYFSTPVEVTRPRSFYAALRFELYTPGLDGINDTLFTLIGPAYPDGAVCLTADTNFVGRNMVLTPAFRQSTASWVGPDEWYPQYFLFAGRGYDLNFLVFPIIYQAPGTSGGVNCQSTGTVIRSGLQGFGLPYPNPAVECIHLSLNTPEVTRATFSLHTSDGRLLQRWDRTVSAGQSEVSLDLQDIPAGAYILHAQTPYGVATFWVNVVK